MGEQYSTEESCPYVFISLLSLDNQRITFRYVKIDEKMHMCNVFLEELFICLSCSCRVVQRAVTPMFFELFSFK